MIVTCVDIWVKEENLTSFIEETRKNHENSIKESGNLRFDVLQSTDDPTKFTLYEAYMTEEDILNHKKTAHYLNWREAVADMMAKPRKGNKHTALFPQDKEQW